MSIKLISIMNGPLAEVDCVHTFEVERGKNGTNEAALIEGAMKFVAMAADEGQRILGCEVELIDDETLELFIKVPADHLAAGFMREFFTVVLEEVA